MTESNDQIRDTQQPNITPLVVNIVEDNTTYKGKPWKPTEQQKAYAITRASGEKSPKRAAVKAGYSERSAAVQGHKMEGDVRIVALINKYRSAYDMKPEDIPEWMLTDAHFKKDIARQYVAAKGKEKIDLARIRMEIIKSDARQGVADLPPPTFSFGQKPKDKS